MQTNDRLVHQLQYCVQWHHEARGKCFFLFNVSLLDNFLAAAVLIWCFSRCLVCVQNLHGSVSQYALHADASRRSSAVNESGFVSLDQPNHVFRCVSVIDQGTFQLLLFLLTVGEVKFR